MKSIYQCAALVCVALLTLAGCGAYGERANPVKPAIESGRPDLIAYAIEGSYTILQKQARVVAEDPTTPDKVKTAIAEVAAKANPILDKIKPLAREATALHDKVKAIEAAGDNDAEARARLAELMADLNRMLTEVSPMVTELVEAIAGTAGEQP